MFINSTQSEATSKIRAESEATKRNVPSISVDPVYTLQNRVRSELNSVLAARSPDSLEGSTESPDPILIFEPMPKEMRFVV